ncbi:dynamin family protein [Prevotella copri]|jgi:predicted GTPase|uniref:Dynamin family protein n=1 Tax=Segatella copri TaxID=165179 RepID=A0AAW5IT62_9BACT|nr:dynamin family protein [Segatella copri]MCP9552451.1 dynamin family protein [Segatella copri]MCP9574540.1 dynamin family protein [Segatella copri]MCP9576276.1 dynamin family protein [Segatella copri]MCP9579133.1 dynamin family protein [Segatella copri]MCP9582123.1 dynamin family protein [Segatella copri]
MEQNLFEEFQNKKNKLKSLALKAKDFGWIDENRCKELIDKLEKDILTIGVIGQMKCGKSTFLNSFVFEDTVLPAATTPMTAALSVITYGEQKKVVAEFYTNDEWEEQKAQAARSLDDVAGDTMAESKIKAAKELVSKASRLGSNLRDYLGKTKEDSFDNIIEYVGADGKYVSITKSVKIYYPKEYLKGVEIVDTPGFNDPIVSREERTKEFLKKADVVLMMLYAGRPFDATDRDIIFKNVSQCGIGKVLIGINKYDIPYCSDVNPEDEEQIKDYVKSEIAKACRESNDNTLSDILSEAEPIPLSAEMALLSELPMSKVNSEEALSFAWNRHCSNFGIGSQPEMRKWSHIDNLVNAIRNLIDKEKSQILFAKPLNAIYAAGGKLKMDNENALNQKKAEITMLQSPDDDLEEREYNLSKACRRLEKKLGFLEDSLNGDVRTLVKNGEDILEDLVDSACNKMENVVETDFGLFTKPESLQPKFDKIYSNLVNRDVKRKMKNLQEEGRRKFTSSIQDFFTDAEDILLKYLPDIDTQDFIKDLQGKIKLDMENVSLFSKDGEDVTDADWLDIIGGFLDEFFNRLSFGLVGAIERAFTHNSTKIDLLNFINSKRDSFDCGDLLQGVFANKDKVINTIRQKLIEGMLNPLQKKVEEIRNDKANKEAKLEEAKATLDGLLEKKTILEVQLEEVASLKNAI